MATSHIRELSGPLSSRITSECAAVVVRLLRNGALRFSEIHRAIDRGSRRTLIFLLRDLERYGLVRRYTIDGHIRYELTALGGSMPEGAPELGEWAVRNRAALRRAAEDFENGRAAG